MLRVDTKMKSLPWGGVRTPIEELPPGKHSRQDILHFFAGSDEAGQDDDDLIDRVLIEELGSTLDTLN